MELSYGQIEDMLLALHEIPEHRRSALRARLKHFKRHGFPAGVNTGSGSRAIYGASQCLALLFAAELLQLGLTPERAMKIISDDAYILPIGALLVGAGLNGELKPRADQDFLVYLDPGALRLLWISPADFELEVVGYGSTSSIVQRLRARTLMQRRVSLINVSRLIADAAHFMSLHRWIEPQRFGDALVEWGRSFRIRFADEMPEDFGELLLRMKDHG